MTFLITLFELGNLRIGGSERVTVRGVGRPAAAGLTVVAQAPVDDSIMSAVYVSAGSQPAAGPHSARAAAPPTPISPAIVQHNIVNNPLSNTYGTNANNIIPR